MKTPEEIMRGLEHCSELGCKDCPYEEDCKLFDEFSIPAEDAFFYIQQLEKRVPRWISVEEKLPECGENVLVCVKNGVDYDWVMVDCRDTHGEWLENADSLEHTVTHWMPLPEPPEEDAHEAPGP